MDYESILTDGNALYRALQASVKGSKWKESSQRAVLDGLSTTFRIAKELKDRTYRSEHQSEFILHERGRLRNVESFNVKDRIVRHVLCDEVFSDKIRKKIIYDNGASVKGRGISFSRKRFEVHLRKYFMEHGTNQGWILFGDFSKYYDNVLHHISKEQLLELVDYDAFISWLLDVIYSAFEIDCSDLTEDEYEDLFYGVFDKLAYDNPKLDKPTRKMQKSVSIGDQLSQQIGIYYPHRIDNYIKIVRGIKLYGRYMDDWYIISDSRDELVEIRDEIIKMGAEIGLHINLKKTYITRLDSIYKYLQIRYTLTPSGKVIKKINPKRVVTMRYRLKKLAGKVAEGTVEYENVENMFRAWMGSFHKVLSKAQRQNLIALYEELFHKKIEIVKGKMIIMEEGSA